MNHTSVNNIGETNCKSTVFESSTDTASVRLSSGMRRFSGFESDSESEEEQIKNQERIKSAKDENKLKYNACPVEKRAHVNESKLGDESNIKNYQGSFCGQNNKSDSETSINSDTYSISVAKGNESNNVKNELILCSASSNNEPCHKHCGEVGHNQICVEPSESCDQEEYLVHVDDPTHTPRDVNKISNSKQNDPNLTLNRRGSTTCYSASEINSNKKKTGACNIVTSEVKVATSEVKVATSEVTVATSEVTVATSEVNVATSEVKIGRPEITVIHGNKVPSPVNYASQFECRDRQGVSVLDVVTGQSGEASLSYSPVKTTMSSPAKDTSMLERFNPFDRDMQTEDDHFSDAGSNYFTTHRNLSSDSNHSPGDCFSSFIY